LRPWIAPVDCAHGLRPWIAPVDCARELRPWIAPVDCARETWRRARSSLSKARVNYALANPANRSPILRLAM